MIRFLLEKEFKQISRNPFLPKMMVGFTLMMMLIMPFAADQEIKNINVSVVDLDRHSYSQRLIQKIDASSYFHLVDVFSGNTEAVESVEIGDTDLILEIRPDFEKDLVVQGMTNVMISSNAVNGIKGGLGSAYMASILSDFATEIRGELHPSNGKDILPVINIATQYRFNSYLDYKIFMVPGLMVILLTLLCGFLPALNIVSEKEIGTIEQMNVTPVYRLTFIFSKLIPYWIIGFVLLTLCFILAAWVYDLFPVGNLGTIYLFSIVYILVVSGMGLIISNYSATMQQAMFVMFFFIMIFIMLSGLFTPINSMPGWAQFVVKFNPLKYFMEVMRMVYLKGSGIHEMWTQLFALLGFAFLFNAWAVISYKKSS